MVKALWSPYRTEVCTVFILFLASIYRREPYSARKAYIFLRDTFRKDGFFALWRGNTATMARIVPYAAIQFTAHEQWKKVLRVDAAG